MHTFTKHPRIIFSALFMIVFSIVNAQTILFEEDFNSCELSDSWTVNVDGEGTPFYEVNTPQNPNSDGSSIDGSCMLIMDDDAAGNNLPGYVLQFITPVFDGTQHTSLHFSADVNYRHVEGQWLRIYVFDGSVYRELAVYDDWGDATGEQFSDFESISADLSFWANPNMHLMIEYSDGGDNWGWWAGVDNILIEGLGDATNVVLENFDDCTLPDGWTTSIIEGDDNWQIGLVDNDAAWAGNSMNGTCFAFLMMIFWEKMQIRQRHF